MERELDRVLHAVLIDADLDVAPEYGRGPFFEDAYFDAEMTDGFGEPPTLILSHIHHEQEPVVIKHLKDGLSPVQSELLETLVTDGGEGSPADIAEEHDRHADSVRSALRWMDDLVEREYGSVSLRSTYVAELVHDAVQQAREEVRDATAAGAKALEAPERGLDERTSAFLAFCGKYDIEYRTAVTRACGCASESWTRLRPRAGVLGEDGLPDVDGREAGRRAVPNRDCRVAAVRRRSARG